jgi:hypothetical protein
MARHSAAEQAALASAIEGPTLAPPPELSAEEAQSWREITASLPPSWFDSGNAPVLAELCRHMALSRQIAEELATMRKRKLTSDTPHGAKQREIFRQLLQAAREESRLIAMLSVKLRLTNSSHRRDERYDDRRRLALQGRRPWEAA